MYHKKNRPPQEHRPRGKEYRCCCPRSRQGAWTRGASAFSKSPKINKMLGFSTLYLGLVDDDVTLPLNETEFLVLRILSNTVVAQFIRNMMLEFSKTLNTTDMITSWVAPVFCFPSTKASQC